LREDTEKLGKVEKKKMKGMQQVEMLSQSFSSLLKIYRNKKKRIEAAEKKIFFSVFILWKTIRHLRREKLFSEAFR
jgi:hypothetical protein